MMTINDNYHEKFAHTIDEDTLTHRYSTYGTRITHFRII